MTQTILGSFTQVSACPTCNGSGKIVSTPCKECKGQGRKEVAKVLSVKIPKGVDTGNKLRINSEGDAGKNGGPSGDLYVVLYVQPHKIFKREGINVFSEVEISFSQAALGDDIQVITLDGEKELKINSGIQSGTIQTIKGLGVPYLNNPTKRGDHYIKINVLTPTHLSEEERKLFKRLGEIQSEKSQKETILDKIKDVFTGVNH